jgi:hypothetical protein
VRNERSLFAHSENKAMRMASEIFIGAASAGSLDRV